MLPIFMIQRQVFWLPGKPLRNIQPFNGFAPMQDIERLLNKMFPQNSVLVLILLHARKLDGRFYLSGGLWSVLWPGLTIPAVFPKTMKCLSVLHKLFAPLLPSALYSSGFSLLVQLLRTCIHSLKRRVDGSFSAILRCVFLQYTKYSCENLPCLVKKSLAQPASSAVKTGS